MIDVRRLEALVALRRHGTVSAAAAALHYGQPTISHHLQRLQVETGSVLVQRVGRGVRLTPDGERLAARGEEILALLGRAEQELVASTSLQAGRVRLAAFPSAAATLVPRLVGALAQRAPGLVLDMVEAEPPEAIELLRTGAVDAALTFSYPDHETTESPDLQVTELFADPLHLVVAAGSTASGALADHRADRWLTGCERCRVELLSLCDGAGFEPTIGFASDDYVAVQALVASGFGVTVLPGLALAAHRHPGVATYAVPDAVRRVRFTTYGAPPRTASVNLLAEVVTQTMESAPTSR